MKQTDSDQWAIACSGLCIVHCLITPVLVLGGASGIVLSVLASELVHQLMLVPVILLALLSFPGAAKRHAVRGPGRMAVGGVMMLLALLSPGWLEIMLTVSGACLLIAAHLWNIQLLARLPDTPLEGI